METLFTQLLQNYGSVDMAEAEFRRMLLDDDELHAEYHEWCVDNDHTERRGFLDFAEEFIANQNSVWDSFKDEYDN